ncbi:hypothetical protein V9T40_011429 [Parthenolecanium corni]|uniref:Uncharacterized protein n=1 Tax=Parthenolecanium corni TaxID=536013 RepID=A0AAN9T5G8_9HEMI
MSFHNLGTCVTKKTTNKDIFYGSIHPTPRTLERTAKVIASEVAIGENTYYGTIRPIGESLSARKLKQCNVEDDFEVFKQTYLATSTPTPTTPTTPKSVTGDSICSSKLASEWMYSGGADGGAGGKERYSEDQQQEQRLQQQQLVYAAESSPLPLQLFISSLSDALSYTSADTTTGADFTFNDSGFGPRGSSVLHVTPMGSTTKLITSDTSSTFRVSRVYGYR